MRFILLFLLSLGCLAAAQNVCRSLPNEANTVTLIEDIITVGDSPMRPTVAIVDMQFLCAASGMFRESYAVVSILANFSCEGSDLCPARIILAQFDFECLGGIWTATILSSGQYVKRDDPVANFTTPTRRDCSICINPSVIPESDSVTHCLACVGCEGANRCFESLFGAECCNYYDAFDGRCLQSCNGTVTEDFTCVEAAFSESSYMFNEFDRTGTIVIVGDNRLTVDVVGGPSLNPAWTISGSDVNRTLPLPSDVSFPITNDNVALEETEVYTLTLLHRGLVIDTTTINIRDDDRIIVGFSDSEYTFKEGDINSSIPVRVFGEVQQTFSVLFVQEELLTSIVEFSSGSYSVAYTRLVSFDVPNDEVGLQSDLIIPVRLAIHADDANQIILGGSILKEATFENANVIIQDDDVIIVGFTEPVYIFIEDIGTATVNITASLPSFIPYSLEIIKINLSSPLDPSTLDMNATVTFEPSTQVFSLSLLIMDDNIVENDETFLLSIVSNVSGVSVGRGDMNLFGNATIIIIDDDLEVTVGFTQQVYTFSEIDGIANVTIGTSFASESSFSVDISSVIVPAEGVITSAPNINDTVDFAVGQTSSIVPIQLTDDGIAVEDVEMFTLVLTSVTSGATIGNGDLNLYKTATVFIVDNDRVSLRFNSGGVVYFELRGGEPVVFLENNIVQGRNITVRADEIARDAGIFSQSLQTVSLILTLSAATGSQTELPLMYTDDRLGREDPEVVTVMLSAVSDPNQINFILDTIVVTVLDDDTVQVEIVGESTRTISEGQRFEICVRKDIETVRDIIFFLETLEISASSDDYSSTPLNGRLPTDSSTEECVTFFTVADDLQEGNEVFSISLSVEQIVPTTGVITIVNGLVEITIVDVFDPAVDVEDTVIGDPLFTVPILGNEVSEHLCYEIRGRGDDYFNFISDSCVSVNAHYISRSIAGDDRPLHVVDEIALRAVSNASSCVNIHVSRTGCTATLGGAVVNAQQTFNGITMTPENQRVRINVPNCDDIDLEMEVICEQIRGVDMLRFEVIRGTNLRESSHGLIAQFWNIGITAEKFNGTLRVMESADNVYILTIPQNGAVRRVPAWLENKTWDNRPVCLYAGNQNGGTVYEIEKMHDPLIQGVYKDYITNGPFDTNFKYKQFEDSRCEAAN